MQRWRIASEKLASLAFSLLVFAIGAAILFGGIVFIASLLTMIAALFIPGI